MSGFDEEMLEEYVVEKFQKNGWNYIPAKELDRDDYRQPLLDRDLIRAIKRINSDKDLEDKEIIRAVKELKLRPSSPDGIKQVLHFLKNGITISSKRGRGITTIKLFDYTDIDKNDYIVTRQAVYQGVEQIRTDVMLYVNGIPLVNIELKNPASISETWMNAYADIKEYEKTVPELYKYVQIGVAAEQTAVHFPIVPHQEDVKKSMWREDSTDPIDSFIKMLSRDRILDLIKNYVFIREEMGAITKVITRYMQYNASEKIVRRVLAGINGEDDKNHGLIWHWQGSGKTLTMMFAANKLHNLKKLENPSIFFIVDRLDLKDQLYQEFVGVDAVQPEIIQNIDELKRIIRYDDYKGKKGVFITLIQKFKAEELEELSAELSKLNEIGKNNISNRKNVITFIDEAHRTQYGALAGQMRVILNSGFFFAFTGTPIAKKEKDTYQKFAYPPEERYMDRYFITDSIKDGFTVKIVYQPRVEKDINFDKKLIETFSEIEFEELTDGIREKVEVAVKNKIDAIDLFLENPDRIKLVANDIAKHFKEHVDGKFKAMIVAANRKSCVYYKRALDQILPTEYSEVIMHIGSKEKDPVIREFKAVQKSKYHGKNIDEIKKEVLEKFKEEDGLPKILIVTDMLLTGFDAPILQTMYLDKPLKEHRLLQAVARTNRPYKDVKEAGYIIDYIGMMKGKLHNAMEMYATDEIQGALYDIADIKEDFNRLMDETLDIFNEIPKNKYDMETLLKAIEILTANNDISETFVENYHNLRRLFEFLGTEPLKLERLEEYKWITAIYAYYQKMVTRDPVFDETVKKYYGKTIKFVHRTTEFEDFQKDLPVVEFDENYLENLEKNIRSDEEKAANIVFALNKLVLVKKKRDPIYESVADKVERILDMWKNRDKNFTEINALGTAIIKEIRVRRQEKKDLGLTDMEFSIFKILEQKFGENENFIGDVKELSSTLKEDIFEGWAEQRGVHKKIEGLLRRFLRRKYYKNYNMDMGEFEEFYQQIIAKVENYAE
ncbi:type I restriction endonuclease subunit R [Methanobacterium formicicum]|uniref:type I site-specific deoxyribonuclease n=1 Tax=Methanobacterium formicicum TaxID=2162 RepID=A0A0S4FLV5_METFO|nr:HsdR family type I site-specific deoxyribonuclease [Methanobacterium formicicum]CEL24000.1 type I restriction enzyme [Methanobacterium formicicum]